MTKFLHYLCKTTNLYYFLNWVLKYLEWTVLGMNANLPLFAEVGSASFWSFPVKNCGQTVYPHWHQGGPYRIVSCGIHVPQFLVRCLVPVVLPPSTWITNVLFMEWCHQSRSQSAFLIIVIFDKRQKLITPLGNSTGRVHKGRGPGSQIWTLTKPIPSTCGYRFSRVFSWIFQTQVFQT